MYVVDTVGETVTVRDAGIVLTGLDVQLKPVGLPLTIVVVSTAICPWQMTISGPKLTRHCAWRLFTKSAIMTQQGTIVAIVFFIFFTGHIISSFIHQTKAEQFGYQHLSTR